MGSGGGLKEIRKVTGGEVVEGFKRKDFEVNPVKDE